MSKKRIGGIVMLVLGVLSILGASVNGTFAEMADRITVANIVTILIMLGLLVGGLVLVITGKKDK